MSLETLKSAIVDLPNEERHSLATWINGLDHDDWDQEMVRDFSPGGRGAHLVERVKLEIAEGKAHPVREGFPMLGECNE